MRIAVLDDYQGVALSSADWSPVTDHPRTPCTVDVFRDHVSEVGALVERLAAYDAVVVMRERTPLPAAVLAALPRLRLVVTTGRRNPSIDVAAATAAGITVCGTESLATAPAELTWALVLGLARQLVPESTAVRDGGWQTTVGRDLAGHTLGLLGLGRIGTQVAAVGRAFGMDVVAWSRSLTPERAAQTGVRAASLDDVLVRVRRGLDPPRPRRGDPRTRRRARAGAHAPRRAARQHLPWPDRRRGEPCSRPSGAVTSGASASTSSTRSLSPSTTRCAPRRARS